MQVFNAKQLKRWREKNEYTQAALAEALGISYHSVWSYEKGRRKIPRVISLALAGLSTLGGKDESKAA